MLPIKTSNWQNSTTISKNFQSYLIEKLRIHKAIVYPFEVKDWLFQENSYKETASNWNELLKSLKCNKTVLSFFYLPKPRERFEAKENDHIHPISDEDFLNHQDNRYWPDCSSLNMSAEGYLSVVERISRHMGPVLYIHGIDNVISTVF